MFSHGLPSSPEAGLVVGGRRSRSRGHVWGARFPACIVDGGRPLEFADASLWWHHVSFFVREPRSAICARAPLTARAMGIFGGACPAGNREAALHSGFGGRLRFHRQPSATMDLTAGVLTGRSGSMPTRPKTGFQLYSGLDCAHGDGSPSSRLGAGTMRTWASREMRVEGRGARERRDKRLLGSHDRCVKQSGAWRRRVRVRYAVNRGEGRSSGGQVVRLRCLRCSQTTPGRCASTNNLAIIISKQQPALTRGTEPRTTASLAYITSINAHTSRGQVAGIRNQVRTSWQLRTSRSVTCTVPAA